ncbi:fatty acid desaturase [Endozoicomonas acroporae]|uniref:fatty acid desaturase n=1 Tax=Endozoicomonas acroporae TaxID=1701104 RepID=UPI003D794564
MSTSSIPVHADDNYREYIQRIEDLKTAQIGQTIPKELFKKNVVRSMTGFLVSYGLYLGSIVGIAYSPHWLLTIGLLITAGLGGWGLHCIAHDCGHGSFSNSKLLNVVVGHLSLIPLLYPFHAWRHVHNMHHGSTNHLEMDTDWRPVSWKVYDRMPRREQLVYLFTRSVGFWAGTVHYWWVSAFRPSFYPRKKQREEVRRSMVFIALVSAVLFPALWYFTGFTGVVLYFLLPLLFTHAWFSITTLMHHTAVDVPFLEKENWSLNGSRILLTTDYLYPRWLLWLTHNISVHAAHHAAPTVPFHNLPKAQKALKEAFPGMIREQPFRFSTLWQIVTQCHFYDPETGYYVSARNSQNKQHPDSHHSNASQA